MDRTVAQPHTATSFKLYVLRRNNPITPSSSVEKFYKFKALLRRCPQRKSVKESCQQLQTVVEKLYFLKKENDDNHSISVINLALRGTGLTASDVLQSRAETKIRMRQRLTPPYISLENPYVAWHPLPGKSRGESQPDFHADISAPLQQIVCWTSRGSRDRKRVGWCRNKGGSHCHFKLGHHLRSTKAI
ncbi:hypothetical protein GOODEAATRI_031980 [Goodea atripinnis]|uniref:Uncharacterized protein n=1 Tax=Goodea atripinnis TaxID=208336 RepID=A0ABV0N6X8_9TELE